MPANAPCPPRIPATLMRRAVQKVAVVLPTRVALLLVASRSTPSKTLIARQFKSCFLSSLPFRGFFELLFSFWPTKSWEEPIEINSTFLKDDEFPVCRARNQTSTPLFQANGNRSLTATRITFQVNPPLRIGLPVTELTFSFSRKRTASSGDRRGETRSHTILLRLAASASTNPSDRT